MEQAEGEVERKLHDAVWGFSMTTRRSATRAKRIRGRDELEAEDDVLSEPAGTG